MAACDTMVLERSARHGHLQGLDGTTRIVLHRDLRMAEQPASGCIELLLRSALLERAFGSSGRSESIVIGPLGIFKADGLGMSLSHYDKPQRGPKGMNSARMGSIRFSYRETAPDHRDNVGQREAMLNGLSAGLRQRSMAPGRYVTVWPVFVVGDSRSSRPSVHRGQQTGSHGPLAS